MTSPTINEQEMVTAVRRNLHDHWQLFVAQGVVMVILGALAVIWPVPASVGVAAFIGWLLFIAGVFRTVALIRSPHVPGYWSTLLLSVLTAILGLVIALFPIQGSVTLTMLLTAYFIAHGIASFALAFSVKDHSGRWGLLLLSGLVDLVLAAFVIAGWPVTGVSVLGLYVGINLLLGGFALVFAAFGARSTSPAT